MPSKAWLTWPPWTLLMMTVKSWLTSWLSWNKYWCTDWGVSNLATFLLPSSLLWQATFQPPLSVSLATFLFLSLFPPHFPWHSPVNLFCFPLFLATFFTSLPFLLAISPASLPHPAALSNSHATRSVQATFLLPLFLSVFIWKSHFSGGAF